MTLKAWLPLPEENGDYLLELDMVQEYVCWFRQRGSETAVVRCRVEGGRERVSGKGQVPRVPRSAYAPTPAAGKGTLRLARARRRLAFLADRARGRRRLPDEAVMEMYGLAHRDVQGLVAEAGCRLIEVDQQVLGHGYENCHFWIARNLRDPPR